MGLATILLPRLLRDKRMPAFLAESGILFAVFLSILRQ
jgi:hypothetical protein